MNDSLMKSRKVRVWFKLLFLQMFLTTVRPVSQPDLPRNTNAIRPVPPRYLPYHQLSRLAPWTRLT
jgi:hypothetical protein